jgi:uncharacterized protein YbjT (DUF2867 family)
MEATDMTTILVLGGTGLLGRPVVDRLLLVGFEVRLLARDPGKARKIVPDSAEIVAGDAARVDDVEQAVKGCQGVHISVSGPADQVSAENVAAVAPGSGLRRITYLSGSTVAEKHRWFPMVAQKLAAEEALRACPVPSTILCPTWPMEQLPRFVRDGQATVIGDQPTPLHWFAAADLARMVSTVFLRDEAADTRLYVHGPQTLPMRDALERFCRAEHPEIQVTTFSIEAARAVAKTSADPAFGFVVEMMAYFDQAGELGDSGEADRLLGPNTITLDRWLEERSRTSLNAAP